MEEEMTQKEKDNDMTNHREESMSTVDKHRALITTNPIPLSLQPSSILLSRVEIPVCEMLLFITCLL